MRKLSLSEVQEVSVDILRDVASICEKENLKYCLIFGTLLGAVRHKGFIPWDDDIDIAMPREDYNKLLKLMKNNTSYPHLNVFNVDTCPSYPHAITRICDNRYILDFENENSYGIGVFIDIYPLDGLGNDLKKAQKIAIKGDRLSSFCFQSTRKHFALETTKSYFRILLKFPVYVVSKLIGRDFFLKQLKKLEYLYKYEQSEYVGWVIWTSEGERTVMKRSWLEDTIFAPFSKYQFRIPRKYDEVLKQLFGNYMELPPKKDQISHHFYDAYKKD